MHSQLIIVGSGPAGWTAALYAARAGLAPTVIGGFAKGGQLMTTTTIDNWPGHQGIMGPELMAKLEDHAIDFGAISVEDEVQSVDFSQKPYSLTTVLGTQLTFDAMIVATGASAKYLGLPSEQEYLGRGVSGCATCDGFFYEGEPVAIVGGGNTAVEEALYLSNIASEVHMIHRRDTFKAEKILVNQLYKKVSEGKIILHLNSTLEEVLGNEDGVYGVKISKEDWEVNLALRGVFIAIGHSPTTEFLGGQVDLDAHGFIKTQKGSGVETATSVPGVFACGDVQDSIYRQAITSAGSGCQAALDAARFIEQNT